MANRMKVSNHPRNYNGNLVNRFIAGHDDVWVEFDDKKSRKTHKHKRPKIGVYRRKSDETTKIDKADLKTLERKGWRVNLVSKEDETEAEVPE